jgi:hypothetical protein
MTYPYSEPLFSNFLLVRMTLARKDLKAFRCHMRQVIDTVFHEKLDWKIVRAGMRENPDNKDEVEILHLAQMPDPANLWEGMYSVAGSSSFAQLSKLVTSERQELLRLAPLSPVKLAPDAESKDYFALSELELEQDWNNLCRWRERLLSLNVEQKTGPVGWPLYATFRPQTGNLRRQINVWQIEQSQQDAARDWEKASDRDSDQLANGTTVVEKRHPIEVYEVIHY